jgi:hypothetical protein
MDLNIKYIPATYQLPTKIQPWTLLAWKNLIPVPVGMFESRYLPSPSASYGSVQVGFSKMIDPRSVSSSRSSRNWSRMFQLFHVQDPWSRPDLKLAQNWELANTHFNSQPVLNCKLVSTFEQTILVLVWGISLKLSYQPSCGIGSSCTSLVLILVQKTDFYLV